MSAQVNNTRRRPLAPISHLADEARRRNPLLFWVVVGHLVLLALMLAVAPFEGRTVLGINVWIKPMKFAIADAVYVATIGWLLPHLPATPVAKRRVSRIVALTIVTETVLVTLQSARGIASHFNEATPLNGAVFSTMGFMIAVNTIVVIYMAVRFWTKDPAIPAPYAWGIRLGLLIFLLASFEGAMMVQQWSHSVGVPDGGPGLPLVNWSTRGGDLRIAHFVGLHSLQVLPFVGYLFSLPGRAGRVRRSVLWVCVIGATYAAIALLLFLQAMYGSPLLSF